MTFMVMLRLWECKQSIGGYTDNSIRDMIEWGGHVSSVRLYILDGYATMKSIFKLGVR